MIMKRMDSDEHNKPVPVCAPGLRTTDVGSDKTAPGFQYRCVPQDVHSLFRRIDARRRIGQDATGPAFLSPRRSQREASLSELFLG